MTQPIIETNIPLPSHYRQVSKNRELASRLEVGHCVTFPADNEADQKALAKRINALRTTLKQNNPEKDFTVRQMYGEIEGTIKPVVRMWRTA